MTVDVEEWFTGVADRPGELDRFPSRLDIGMGRLLDLFERTGTRATFFFLGCLAERYPRWVGEVARRGHEVGVHGHHHIPLWHLAPPEVRADVARAHRAVLEAGAPAVTGYRAPLFSIDRRTTWAYDVLEEAGFEYSSSVFPIHNPRYGFPGAPRFPFRPTASGRFVEFPLSTIGRGRVALPFCGGFYLRALPMPVVTGAFLRLAAEGRPAVCYVHPWELDPEQPALPVGPLARLRHGIGLSSLERRLEELLRRFSFAPMREVLRDLAPARARRRLPLAPPQPGPPDQGTDRPRTSGADR
jgi:polysaccharide deacetylase family protein (PEP-CTERM system associated)